MPYISGGRTDASGPLNRFLPPAPESTARGFVAGLKLPGAWILDPFAASPRMAVEMARAGQRVLVTAGNPVSRFMLDLAAHPPKLTDLQAALADLAAARKEGQRLETLLQSMYLTRCENCEREIPAEAFLWDSKSSTLTGRIYNCICGSGGEHPITPEDEQNAARWAHTDGLHRSRALGRVAATDDPDRPFAEEALNFYPPRAIFALVTIINRLDALSTTDERRRCMTALLLYAMDAANALWPHTSERPRPRALTFPAVYRENNVWLALEAGVKAWASEEYPIPLTLWPEEPPESGGLCIFEGPLRELAPELTEISLKAVVGALPRPNQAFWTLSALWSGWLWGQAASGPFKAVLRRRRYDWQWHAEALKALFASLVGVIPFETPFFAILAEPEPSFISAAFLAACAAGFDIDGVAVRGESDPIQILWEKMLPSSARLLQGATAGQAGKGSAASWTASRKKPLPLDVKYTRKIVREILEAHGQPLPYIHLHAFTLATLAEKDRLQFSEDALSELEKNIHTALDSPEIVDLENRTTPETGTWGLKKWGEQRTLKGL
jgi:hypothetical protein